MQTSLPGQSGKRIDLVDFARGIALVAMTLFHFGWDLELFGFAEPGFASQPAMVWFARCIATSFLFLVGLSLVLAHDDGIRVRPFSRRLAMVAGAALLITVATWFATPGMFIFFGILHHIAVASVLGLLFIRLPPLVSICAAAVVLVMYFQARTTFLDAPIWWWTGLNLFTPRASDYVPIFPFFAAVLTGIAGGRWVIDSGLAERWAQVQMDGAPSRLLRFIGRNSLVYYLLHQPVLIAFLYAIHAVVS